MASVDVRSQGGNVVGSVDLADDVFGLEPNVPVMLMLVVLPVLAPAVSVMLPEGVNCGAGTAEGVYCRT